MADAGTPHGNLFRDGTIRNSRTNCSAARCIGSLADGLVSINQEKLVDHQFRIMAAHSFFEADPPPSPLRKAELSVLFKNWDVIFTEDAGSIAADFLGVQVCFCQSGLSLACKVKWKWNS